MKDEDVPHNKEMANSVVNLMENQELCQKH